MNALTPELVSAFNQGSYDSRWIALTIFVVAIGIAIIFYKKEKRIIARINK